MARAGELETAERRRVSSGERRAARSISQRASSLRRLAVVWILGLLLMVAVGLQNRVPVEDLLLDASVVGGGHWYSGFVTSLGVVIWTMAATSAFGAGYVSHVAGRPRATTMLGVGGLIISALLFDDLYLLHSNLIPKVTGLPKMATLAAEALAVLGWIAACRSEIARTRWELLAASALGFAGSVATDQAWTSGGTQSLMIEDGAKLLGTLALAAWSVSTAADLVRSTSAVRPPSGRLRTS